MRDTSNNFVISDFIDRTKLTNMTSSHDNYVIGYSAFTSNIDGAFNIAIGTNSLEFNEGGSDNIAIGYNSLMSNTDGSYNIALGNYSSYSGLAGNNISIGYYSLYNNNTGANNVCIGLNSLHTSLDASTNVNNSTYVGSDISQNSFGLINDNFNVGIGYGCATDYTTNRNVQDASYNTFIGAYTGISNGFDGTTLTQSTAIGYGSQITASNQIMMGTNKETVNVPGSFLLEYDPALQNTLKIQDITDASTNIIMNGSGFLIQQGSSHLVIDPLTIGIYNNDYRNIGISLYGITYTKDFTNQNSTIFSFQDPQTITFAYDSTTQTATFNCNYLTMGCLNVNLTVKGLVGNNINYINVINVIPGCQSQFFLNNNTGNDITFSSTPATGAKRTMSSFGGSTTIHGSTIINNNTTGLFTFNYDGTIVYVSSSSFY